MAAQLIGGSQVKILLELERDEAVLVVAGMKQYSDNLEDAGKRPSVRKRFKADRLDFKKASRMSLEVAAKAANAVEEAERQPGNAVVDADLHVHGGFKSECQACGSSSCICPTERSE
jgi:hypothetical protein